jgi:shikimate dehydrogenase
VRTAIENAICIPFHVSAADLAGFFAGLHTVQNLLGLIITIPHKPAAARYAATLTDRARKVGSANIMRPEADGTWTGDIVDGFGLVSGLLASGQRIEGRRALVVGSGGVGRAIAFAIADARAASVHVYDVMPERAEDLAARLGEAGTPSGIAPPAAKGFDLVVNASPLGMKQGDPLPIDPAGLDEYAIAVDVVVHPVMTPWLSAAAAQGCYV